MTQYQSNKKKGWFSNRYQTAGAHLKAKEDKIRRAEYQLISSVTRAEERKQRTPQQQIEVLDNRLGKEIGATKERKRLAKQIKELDSRPRPEKSAPDKSEHKGRDRKSVKQGGRR